MKRTLAGLLGLLLLSACGGAPAQSNATLLAGALRSADVAGMGFNLDEQLLIHGGDIPSGQAIQLHATASNGELRDGAAEFGYEVQQGSQGNGYDMRIVDGKLFVRRKGASAWKATPVGNTTTLLPALRLDVVRETVLLATSVSSGALGHVAAGFDRKYVVQPAADQVEQLLSITVTGATEQQFLKTASAEVDVYLTVPDNKLARVEVHVGGTDPSNGEQSQITSSIDLHSARVSAIQAPADAQLVDPGSVLS